MKALQSIHGPRRRPGRLFACITVIIPALLVAILPLSSRANFVPEIFGLQIRGFSTPPDFQHWLPIDTDGTPGEASIVFGDGTPNSFVGGIWALARLDDVIYGVEWVDGAGAETRLVRFSTAGFVQGVRVGTEPIGFRTIEGLAAGNGMLYGASVDFDAHSTSIVTIDPVTGVGGETIGTGPFNVILTGLAFDPIGGMLYGCGLPWGGGDTAVNDPNLYRINPQTGAFTLVGNIGTQLHSLAWHGSLGLIGAFRQLYQVDTSTGVGTVLNAGVDFAHDGTDGNGVYGLAAEIGDVPAAPFRITDIRIGPGGDLIISWESEAGASYAVLHKTDIAAPDWQAVAPVVPAKATMTSHTFPAGSLASGGVIRVRRNE